MAYLWKKNLKRNKKKKKKLKGENRIRNHREKLDLRIKVLFYAQTE